MRRTEEEEKAVERFLPDFLEAEESAFLNYWFSGDYEENISWLDDNPWLGTADKLDILRDAYRVWKSRRAEDALDVERSFLDDHPDEWADYMRGI